MRGIIFDPNCSKSLNRTRHCVGITEGILLIFSNVRTHIDRIELEELRPTHSLDYLLPGSHLIDLSDKNILHCVRIKALPK